MLKNILIIVLLLVVFNAFFVFSGGLDLLVKTEQREEQKNENISPDIVDVFRFTLENEVDKKKGKPIEGYEPQMFLDVFDGLVETDFAGAQAWMGEYVIVEGRLEHDTSKVTSPIHSAAGAMNRVGYGTLLNNVSTRTGIDLQGEGTITDVINVIAAQ